jgi:hypothetical protein
MHYVVLSVGMEFLNITAGALRSEFLASQFEGAGLNIK